VKNIFVAKCLRGRTLHVLLTTSTHLLLPVLLYLLRRLLLVFLFLSPLLASMSEKKLSQYNGNRKTVDAL